MDTKVDFPLKYLSNFWRSLNLFLINFEMELDLLWSKDSIVSEILRNPAITANPAASPPTPAEPATSTTEATFQINSTKPYVLVVTFSINDKINF